MNSYKNIGIVVGLFLVMASCADKNSPNYQYMPDMYEAVGYETYQKVDFLPNGMEAGLPVENTISRGWMPYEFANDLEGRDLARLQASPLDSLKQGENLVKGKELFSVYCAVCHGTKGDGQGNLVKREKILGVPSYADAGRIITAGGTYYTIYYGLNSMGSYANQLNHEERWQVSEYVMQLKQDLTK
ncbi:cytochrome c [Cellulophaga sp. F20128]|uniref:c-type cytochrome n=1 Tax=Cellulophaga sp. F20128 TaxID=2926413 RepID=UPI001FF3ACDF|nr:cytochrome c [Cellulophaga sp. F20128]MCK0155581.1 cytochrome c [Cellulophaga sp. F20128]